jgi:hypothetical protein
MQRRSLPIAIVILVIETHRHDPYRMRLKNTRCLMPPLHRHPFKHQKGQSCGYFISYSLYYQHNNVKSIITMRHFTLTNYLAASLATNPVDSLSSLHSSQGTARVQKLGSAVMRAPIVESSMLTPSPVSTDEPSTRRSALQSILFGSSVAFMAPMGALALDMDAFANGQVRHFIL